MPFLFSWGIVFAVKVDLVSFRFRKGTIIALLIAAYWSGSDGQRLAHDFFMGHQKTRTNSPAVDEEAPPDIDCRSREMRALLATTFFYSRRLILSGFKQMGSI